MDSVITRTKTTNNVYQRATTFILTLLATSILLYWGMVQTFSLLSDIAFANGNYDNATLNANIAWELEHFVDAGTINKLSLSAQDTPTNSHLTDAECSKALSQINVIVQWQPPTDLAEALYGTRALCYDRIGRYDVAEAAYDSELQNAITSGAPTVWALMIADRAAARSDETSAKHLIS
jgi:tetratricopeptide (TPR) repeat protein